MRFAVFMSCSANSQGLIDVPTVKQFLTSSYLQKSFFTMKNDSLILALKTFHFKPEIEFEIIKMAYLANDTDKETLEHLFIGQLIQQELHNKSRDRILYQHSIKIEFKFNLNKEVYEVDVDYLDNDVADFYNSR